MSITVTPYEKGTMYVWHQVIPDWSVWLDVLEGIAGSQKTFAAICNGQAVEWTNIRHSLLGAMKADGCPRKSELLRVFRKLGVVNVCGRRSLLAIPAGDCFHDDKALGFVACGREPDWSNFRQLSCIRLVTDALTGKLPEECGKIAITVGVTEESPLLFACMVFASIESSLGAILKHTKFAEYKPDNRSATTPVISWDLLREVVGLAR